MVLRFSFKSEKVLREWMKSNNFHCEIYNESNVEMFHRGTFRNCYKGYCTLQIESVTN